jgi:hypothetical protein
MLTFGAWPKDPVAVTAEFDPAGEDDDADAEDDFDELQPATTAQASRGIARSARKRRMKTSGVVDVSPVSLLAVPTGTGGILDQLQLQLPDPGVVLARIFLRVVNVEVTGPEQEAAESPAAPSEPNPLTGSRVVPWFRRRRRPLTVVACLGAVAALYVAYLGQSRSLGTDADGASNVLQAWDMLHGNLLLRGWWLSDVSFYTTELPEYMLVELARGLNPGVINLAAAATYTLLLALAALLAKGRATGKAAVGRVLIAAGIMLAPGPVRSAGTLLSSPDHTGTGVPLLLTWLAIDRLGDRRYLPWLVCALLTWVELADQIAIYVGALPVILVSGIRICQRRGSWRADAGLLAAAAASVVLALASTRFIQMAGGFVLAPVPVELTTAAQLPHRAWLTVQSVLTVFGADFIGLRSWPATAVAMLHLAGVILVAWACCIAARRLLAADERLVPLLLAGVAINLAAYVFSTQSFDLGSTHELAAVLPFGAVLAGRLLPGRPAIKALFPALLAVLVGYAGALAYNAAGPPRPPTTQAVASWLTAHHLTAGIGDYWTANITTVATGGRVQVRPVSLSCGRFSPYAWESKESWYGPPNTATFLLLSVNSNDRADGNAAEAITQFGPPRQTARVGTYEVLVWNRDLLPALTGGFARGCGPKWQR